MSQPKKQSPVVAVIGNPNTGKSTLFNLLTGMKQHVGNYAGVTVERKTGTAQLDENTAVELIDLPGTYSLAARSPDEMIAVDVLLNQQVDAPAIDAILAIADASNPERNFYLISQLLEAGLPVVVALNMLDVAATKGITVDVEKISAKLGTPVVGICANKAQGLPELKRALLSVIKEKKSPAGPLPKFPDALNAETDGLLSELNAQKDKLGRTVNRVEAFRALIDKGGHAEERLTQKLGADFSRSLAERRARATNVPAQAEEVRTRYAWVKNVLGGAVTRPAQPPATKSDTIDKFVTHWASGTLIFAALMFIVFQCIFIWAKPAMDLIVGSFDALGGVMAGVMPDGALKSLVVSGVIKGVGSVLVFLPQICLLFLFIAIMEDCGYMARAAFLMDRLLSRVGLSGKSFIPMLSSFACAVPGIMATRTIENWRDRITTILVAPLMSCSARLPVYGLMIYTFIPNRSIFFNEAEYPILSHLFGLQGVVLFAMYFVGMIVAVPVAWILKKTLLKGETPPFLIELPSYKIPDVRSVMMSVFDRAKAFIWRAGTIILAVNVAVWALAYFPRPAEVGAGYDKQREMVQAQTAGEINTAIAPLEMASLKDEKSSPLAGALTQAEKYDADKDAKIAALGPIEGDEAAAAEKKILDEHAQNLDALSKVNGVTAVWPKAVLVRSARAAQKDRLEELDRLEAGAYLRASYFGQMGHAVEPLFRPLGWDWRISMAAIASFPAREVIVATLGTIFNQGEGADDQSKGLKDALVEAKWDNQPERKLFNIPVALSIMVFFALCSQCAATLATIKRETNSWSWPVFSFVYMTVLAYFGAMLVYQIGMRF